MQAFAAHGPSAAGSAAVLPAAVGARPAVEATQSKLPQLVGYSDSLDSSQIRGAGDVSASAKQAAARIAAGQLTAADTAVQLQQPQLRTVAPPAAAADVAAVPSRQQLPSPAERAAESGAGKEALYEALWRWAANVTGMVSAHICSMWRRTSCGMV
jgi:hypothetical protein